MTTKIRIKDTGFSDKEITFYTTELPDEVAHFAMSLITAHANVAGKEDGEDSQGRSRLRLQTPEELVDRSFKISALAFEAVRKGGHVIQLPDLNEINQDFDAERAAERKAAAEAKAAKAAKRALENA